MNRLETLAEFEKAIELTKKFPQIFIGIHIIFGLPYEEESYHIKIAEYINKLGIAGVKIHNLYIPKTSRLAKFYKDGEFELSMNQDEFVKRVYEFLKVLNKNIVIMRIGGTAPPDELLAPDWAKNKFTTFQKLNKLFKAT